MIRNTLLLLVLIASFSACKQSNDNNQLILGKWQGATWLINDNPSDLDAKQVHFEFNQDGTYSAEFGSQKESGKWRTEKDKLYTTGTGKQEIMVKILKADGASFDFEMNRGGRKETLQLVKEQ